MLDFIFSQEELFWLDDILPGKSTEIIKDEKGYLKNLISEEPLKSKVICKILLIWTKNFFKHFSFSSKK